MLYTESRKFSTPYYLDEAGQPIVMEWRGILTREKYFHINRPNDRHVDISINSDCTIYLKDKKGRFDHVLITKVVGNQIHMEGIKETVSLEDVNDISYSCD